MKQKGVVRKAEKEKGRKEVEGLIRLPGRGPYTLCSRGEESMAQRERERERGTIGNTSAGARNLVRRISEWIVHRMDVL